MRKSISYIRLDDCPSHAELRGWAFESLRPQLEALESAGLKLSLTEAPPPRLNLLMLSKAGVVLVSTWADDELAHVRAGDVATRLAREIGARCQSFQVTESTPVAYPRDWPDGEPTPGIVLLTALKKHPAISYETFMHEWHDNHTPMAIEIHPLWGYIRNVVDAPLDADSPGGDSGVSLREALPFQGFVEEHYRSPGDPLNPLRMYGGALRCASNMARVYRHTSSFIDYDAMQNHLVKEYILRSPVAAGR